MDESKYDDLSETEESAALARWRSADEAVNAAQAVVPGNRSKFEIDNVNGGLVYGVEIGCKAAKVDAGTGVVWCWG